MKEMKKDKTRFQKKSNIIVFFVFLRTDER